MKVSERHLDALGGVSRALAELQGVATPAQLYDAATAAVCRHCGFRRAILFGVEGDELVARSVHFADHPVWAREILALGQGDGRPQLAEMILETEMIRRRAPAIVSDAQNDPRASAPIVRASRTTSYVAAPIMPQGKVIGFIHGDVHGTGREVDELDRDILWTFAEGYGYAVEGTLLRTHLAMRRRELEELASATRTLATELLPTGSALALGHAPPVPRAPVGPAGVALTAREHEVLDLLVEGDTNATIARKLYISESTAKAHVKHILRKLRATNRADAVSKWLRGAES